MNPSENAYERLWGILAFRARRVSIEPEQRRHLPRAAAQLGLGPVHGLPQLLDLAVQGLELVRVAPVVLEGADEIGGSPR